MKREFETDTYDCLEGIQTILEETCEYEDTPQRMYDDFFAKNEYNPFTEYELYSVETPKRTLRCPKPVSLPPLKKYKPEPVIEEPAEKPIEIPEKPEEPIEAPQKPKNERTRACHFGKKCKRHTCTFAHNLKEFNPQVCKFNVRCKRMDCVFKHSFESMEEYVKRNDIHF